MFHTMTRGTDGDNNSAMSAPSEAQPAIRRRRAAAAALALWPLRPGRSGAQGADWPARPVRILLAYPPGGVVQEWQAHSGDGFALGSANWVPARYANVDQPQVPHIYLALYGPPLTGTLEAWLDAHGTAASFCTESGEQVGFWGVWDAVPAGAGNPGP